MDPRAGLDRCGKSRPPPGFDPRTFQPVANRYIDYVTRPTKKREDTGNERGSIRSHCVEKWYWKRLWSCRNTDNKMNE